MRHKHRSKSKPAVIAMHANPKQAAMLSKIVPMRPEIDVSEERVDRGIVDLTRHQRGDPQVAEFGRHPEQLHPGGEGDLGQRDRDARPCDPAQLRLGRPDIGRPHQRRCRIRGRQVAPVAVRVDEPVVEVLRN